MEIFVGGFFFFKQKTAYEIGTGDWSSDVCSSDLATKGLRVGTKDIDRAMQTEQSRIKNGTQCYIFWRAREQNNAL